MKNARLPDKAKSSAAGVVHRIKSILQFIAVLPTEFVLLLALLAIVWGAAV